MINLGFKAFGNPAMGTTCNIYALIHPENQTAKPRPKIHVAVLKATTFILEDLQIAHGFLINTIWLFNIA